MTVAADLTRSEDQLHGMMDRYWVIIPAWGSWGSAKGRTRMILSGDTVVAKLGETPEESFKHEARALLGHVQFPNSVQLQRGHSQ